jgi:hypothetical protein
MDKKNRLKQQSFYDESAAEKVSAQIMDSYESGIHDGDAGPLSSNVVEGKEEL